MIRRSLLLATAAGCALGRGGLAYAAEGAGEKGETASPSLQAVGALAKPKLPFSVEALAPRLSADAVRSHFAGFHIPCYQRLLNLEAGTRGSVSLTELIRQSAGQPSAQDLYVATTQLFNHNLYWSSIAAPRQGAVPALIEGYARRDFGGMRGLQEALLTAALDHTGPGWLWLLAGENGRLRVQALDDASSPMALGLRPLLTVDLWEHAYYLDYRHRRSAYLSSMLDLLNWDFAAAMLLAGSPGSSRT